MSFRSVVNGECFEEASFNNTLSDSFQEPAVSNMSVAMVTAACLCSASHICVFHGPPSLYRWRGLKNILHWEHCSSGPPLWKLHPQHFILLGLLGTDLQRASLYTSYERRKSIKPQGDETSAPPDLTEQAAPSDSSTELSPTYREVKRFQIGGGDVGAAFLWPHFPHSLGEEGVRVRGDMFLAPTWEWERPPSMHFNTLKLF